MSKSPSLSTTCKWNDTQGIAHEASTVAVNNDAMPVLSLIVPSLPKKFEDEVAERLAHEVEKGWWMLLGARMAQVHVELTPHQLLEFDGAAIANGPWSQSAVGRYMVIEIRLREIGI